MEATAHRDMRYDEYYANVSGTGLGENAIRMMHHAPRQYGESAVRTFA